jgi:sugar/nucleoside kinase (ribokinase family)
MSLLVVGSVAIDSIETPHGIAPEIVGGSATHFAYAASFFAPVRLCGVVGEDFPAEYLDALRGRPIDLGGLEVKKGKSFRWSGRYHGSMAAAETLSVELNLFGEWDPQVPAAFRGSPFVFLANGSPHVQRRVLAQIDRSAPRFVLLDTMNLWIEMERRALFDLLERVDALVINDEEIRQLTGEPNLIVAGRRVLGMGPRVVILKKGEHGALLFDQTDDGPARIFAAPAWPVERVFDPTGAGDTFAGGFMGTIARGGAARPSFAALKRAVCMGIVMGSFNVEDFGLNRLRRAVPDEIAERYRSYLAMLAVEPEPVGDPSGTAAVG